MATNYRFDAYNNTLEPTTITNEIHAIPATTPYKIKLTEVPYQSSPSTMSMRVFDYLAAAIASTTATTITVLHGDWFAAGSTITIDTEELYISTVSDDTLTVTRGYNSTTANTHSSGAYVYIESSMDEVSSEPSIGQFFPDYACEVTDDSSWNTGTILFNADDAGKLVAVSYKGLGTLVDDRFIDFSISPNLRNFGDGSDGDIYSTASFTATSAILKCKNFTLNSGHTMTGVGPLQIILCTDTCTIAGSITTKGLGSASNTTGNGGGAGGRGDDDSYSGGSSYINGILVASSPSGTPSAAVINQFLSFFTFCTLAGGGGAAGGAGGGGLIIIARKLLFSGSIIAAGAAATSGSYSGGGGGGGVILATKEWISDTGTIDVSGGSCGSWATAGGAGWYRKITID